MNFVLAAASPGWWTTEHGLLVANLVLASVAVLSILSSRASLSQEREALQASVRPVIVDVPMGVYMTGEKRMGKYRTASSDRGLIVFARVHDESLFLSVPIRNIGAGPAFVDQAWLGMPKAGTVVNVDHQVIPANELAEVWIELPKSSHLHESLGKAHLSGEYWVRVNYFDLSGRQRFQTVIQIVTKASGPEQRERSTRVKNVELARCDRFWRTDRKSRVTTGRSREDMDL